MLKFAVRLGKPRASDESGGQSTKFKARSHAFSFTRSPLTRVLSRNVGKGQAAHDLQRVADAAVRESGIKHVTPSRSVDSIRTQSSIILLI